MTPIEILVRNGITVPNGSRGQVKMFCPKCHEQRRDRADKSLSVNSNNGTWYCHHCLWSGPNYESLKDRQYSRPNPEKLKPLTSKVYDYFSTRGIPKELVFAEKIAMVTKSFDGVEKSAIAFPFYENGQLVNVKYRFWEDGAKKFSQEKDAKKIFYRDDALRAHKDMCLICEGEIDALSFMVAGVEDNGIGVVSIPMGGVQPDSNSDSKLGEVVSNSHESLRDKKEIYLACDNDEVGSYTNELLSCRLGKMRCRLVKYPQGCKDANDVLVKLGKEALMKCVADAKPYPIDGIHLVEDMREKLLNIYKYGYPQGAACGEPQIDNLIKLFPGFPFIVSGVPGHGKSSLLDYYLCRLSIKNKHKFALFSPENWPVESHIHRLAEIMVGKSMLDNNYKMSPKELDEAIKYLNDHFFIVRPDDERFTLDKILAKFEEAIQRYGVNGCVIDPWNTIEHQIRESGMTSYHEYVGWALARISTFAQRYNQFFFIVAHPRKMEVDMGTGEYRVPTLYDISGASDWYNKAGYGCIVYRGKNGDDDVTKLIVQKVKNHSFMGKPGESNFTFDLSTQRFVEYGRPLGHEENWIRVAGARQKMEEYSEQITAKF